MGGFTTGRLVCYCAHSMPSSARVAVRERWVVGWPGLISLVLVVVGLQAELLRLGDGGAGVLGCVLSCRFDYASDGSVDRCGRKAKGKDSANRLFAKAHLAAWLHTQGLPSDHAPDWLRAAPPRRLKACSVALIALKDAGLWSRRLPAEARPVSTTTLAGG